ncbi:MAG: putative permease of the drug/metabolite transporter superfamily [Alphaproteobacteria bacterium]|nr:putative permease of the drug/metabolite transporter superfamily [Alphaproteobacteria bacterium]
MKPADLAIALAVMLMWGLNFVMAKIGLEHWPPIFFVMLRFALVAAFLLPFVRLPRAHLPRLLALSVVLGSLHFPMMFTAMQTLDAGTAAVVVQLQVPFAALLGHFIYQDRLGWRSIVGMALAFGGVLLITGEPRLSGQLFAVGLVVVAAFMFAIANIQMKGLGDLDGNSINAWTSLFAAPQLLAISLVLESGHVAALREATWDAIAALLYQVVIMVIISYALWYRLLRTYSVGQVMPLTLLLPILGVLSGVLLLGEPMSWQKAAGGMLTVLGVGVIVIRRARVAEPRTGSTT